MSWGRCGCHIDFSMPAEAKRDVTYAVGFTRPALGGQPFLRRLLKMLEQFASESRSKKWRYCVADLSPLLFDVSGKLERIWKCLKSLDFSYPKNSTPPVEWSHIVGTSRLNCPGWYLWAEFQQERPIP